MTNVKKAKFDPASTYQSPDKVVNDQSLSKEEKLEVLKQWEYDEREMQVASEEAMTGEETSVLDDIHNAMHELGYYMDESRNPNKQGSI